jgi:hypothetical protein
VDSLDLTIADVRFGITSRTAHFVPELEPAYAQFISRESAGAPLHIDVRVEADGAPAHPSSTPLFDTGEAWSVHPVGAELAFKLPSPRGHGEHLWVARAARDFSAATVYCGRDLIRRQNGSTALVNPVRYPLDQILLMHYLSTRQGLLLHSAGMEHEGQGYLFLGYSGAGKTTVSRLLAAAGHRMLSDDRMAVRRQSGQLRIYGTPWPGDAAIAVNDHVALGAVFFLEQASRTEVIEIDGPEALERLLPVASIPWYDRSALLDVLQFCDELIEAIPTYLLRFTPDAAAASAIRATVAA